VTLTRPRRALLGLATVLAVLCPFIVVALAIGGLLLTWAGAPYFEPRAGFNPDVALRVLPLMFVALFPVLSCSGMAQLALQVLYQVLIVQDQRLRDPARALLSVGVWLAPYLALPAYFIVYLWDDPPPGMAARLTASA
jgi:hypothetical protein